GGAGERQGEDGGREQTHRPVYRLGSQKPTSFLVSSTTGAAMSRALATPFISTRSISAGSPIRRRISAPIGPSLCTARSARAGLKVPKPLPPNSAITSAFEEPARAA